MTSIFPTSNANEWKQKIIAELKGGSFEQVIGKTQDGRGLMPFYTSEERIGITGIQANEAWRCRQDFWGKKESELNPLILESLAASVSSIGIEWQEGDDLIKLLENIQLELIDLHIKTDEPSEAITSLESLANKKKIPLHTLRGSLDHDPIAEALIRGTWKASSQEDMSMAFKDIEKLQASFGRVCIHGDVYHMAGATSVQELYAVLASALTYLERAEKPNELIPRMRFRLSMDSDFYETVAKSMALKILWANLSKAYGASPAAAHLTMVGSGWDSAPLDQDTNLIRSSSQAFAAIVGGCDELIIPPHDGDCNAFSMRMSRNIQHLLRHEAYMDTCLNPTEGAYLFEQLAKEMAEQVWEKLKDLKTEGSFLEEISSGSLQQTLHTSGVKKSEALLNAERPWLGVNLYRSKEEQELKDITWTEAEGTAFPSLTFPIFQVA